MKRRTFNIFVSVAALTLSLQTAPAHSPTYLLDGKPISAHVYQAGLLVNLGVELSKPLLLSPNSTKVRTTY